MTLKCIVELDIVDVIHNHGKPMTLHELASYLKLHPSKVSVLYKFLRLLTHDGFFVKTKVKGKEGEEEETSYALTPPSKLLISGESTCVTPLVNGIFHPSSLDIWHSSKKWLTEDKDLTLYESATGETFSTFLTKILKYLVCFKGPWQLILMCLSLLSKIAAMCLKVWNLWLMWQVG